MKNNIEIIENALDYDTVYQMFNKIAIFGGFTEDKFKFIFPLLKKCIVKKDDYIFEQGFPSNNIYIIEKGSVKIVRKEGNFTYDIIDFTEGDCFGEIEAIGIMPYIASAIATDNCELIVLSNKSLHTLYKTNIKIFSHIVLNIARESCRRLAETDKMLTKYLKEEEIINK